jgi:nitroreductase
VPREILERIIEAANLAPSGMNTQPWRFVVVQDEGFRKKLLERAIPNSIQYLQPVKESNPARFEVIMKRYAELPDPVYYGAPAIVFVVGRGPYAAESWRINLLSVTSLQDAKKFSAIDDPNQIHDKA